jgi:gamma-glutamylcyclotransferase (GGCT)/AIG2-like uncharacterized protein YtfP
MGHLLFFNNVCSTRLFLADSTAASLRGYRMAFNMKGGRFVEPAYAGLVEDEAAITHGLAFCMDSKSEAKLDRDERSYDKKWVSVHTYDGRHIDRAIVYMSPKV